MFDYWTVPSFCIFLPFSVGYDLVTHVFIMIHKLLQLLLMLLQGPRFFLVAILHEVDPTASQVCLTDLESVVPLLELQPDCSEKNMGGHGG